MGTSLACMYATIYFSYWEETCILKNKEKHGLVFYRRYIDDGYCIQLQTPGAHAGLLEAFNSFGEKGKRLEWTSTAPSMSVNFLDLDLTIENGYIKSRTFVKPMNLFLFIPSHSAHSPSVLKSLIHGQLRRFWQQNSDKNDYVKFVNSFLSQLVNRGHDREKLIPLFLDAADKLDILTLGIDQEKQNVPRNQPSRAFFHLEYHEFQIPRKIIQSTFQRTCAVDLREAKSNGRYRSKLDIQRLIVAQSRAPNLRDRLCRTTLRLPEGKRVSDYIATSER